VAVCCRKRLEQAGSIALIMLATVGVAAQDRPDVSGRWVPASPRQSEADIPLALSVRQTLVRTTVRGEPMRPFFRDITIERQFETGTRSENHLIGMQGGTVPGLRADGIPNGPSDYPITPQNGTGTHLSLRAAATRASARKPARGLNDVKSGPSMPTVACAWRSSRVPRVMVRRTSR
jgi:hypothetical protein